MYYTYAILLIASFFTFTNSRIIHVNETSERWSLFQRFVNIHDKIYSNEEEFQRRFEIFKENINYAVNHNEKELSYKLGVTIFADMTTEEFKDFNGFLTDTHINGPFSNKCSAYKPSTIDSDVPSSYDWRDHGAVTSVKDQGQCGSCWSFSATGAVEGAWAISSGKLQSLSEQQLVDCSKSYGNHGCYGGLMDSAFMYIIDNGSCLENDYPYEAKGGECLECNSYVTLSDCMDVSPNNQLDLKSASSVGPVSVAIEADTRDFQLYTSGVISGSACGTDLDHGVLIVGYGTGGSTHNEPPYWIVKNSWGPSWGDNGYVRIERSESTNDPGVCGIAMQPSFPIV